MEDPFLIRLMFAPDAAEMFVCYEKTTMLNAEHVSTAVEIVWIITMIIAGARLDMSVFTISTIRCGIGKFINKLVLGIMPATTSHEVYS